MSVGGFQTVLISAPTTPVTSSNCLENSVSNPDKVSESSAIQLETHMLIKRDSSPDVAVGSPGFMVEQPSSQTALQSIDADYNSNSFNFSYDGSFSLSPQQNVDMKDLEKGDAASVILSSQPLSNSSHSTASPKSFLALGISEAKGDKMISGFEGRALSPLTVMRFQPSAGDAMLSGLGYSDGDMGFDVPTLDGLLGAGGGPGLMLDGDMNQETYMETGQDLQLSPQAFHSSGDTFVVRESSPMTVLNDIKQEMKNKASESAAASLVVDKLKVKGSRPVKATSPNRPGTQPCPTCGKVFSNSSALTKHKLTHSDERKYVCQLCAKAFKRQDHLNGHMLTHRNKKPFECDAEGCGKSYCDARSLRRHKENHHSSTSSTTLTTTLSSQVSVIPGLAHLGFNSLQTSFPASVITSAAAPPSAFAAENRIQYAPAASRAEKPPTTSTVSSSVIPSMQFLTFQKGGGSAKEDEAAAAASWQTTAQTINTGALLLAQNFSGNFEAADSSGGSEKQELGGKEPQLLTPQELSEACFEVVNSSTGAKQLVALTPQGSVNLQFESGAVVRGDFPRGAMQIVKIEAPSEGSSTPTTPTGKEVVNGSPLLQQLLNQQQGSEAGVSIVGSRAEHSFLTTLSEQSKQSSSQLSPVLMSRWSQVLSGTNSTSSRFSQDPKPVECSLCQRKFKNIPALNGHMRLHGGYFKKENDAKKNDKKNPSHPPLQTASTNVRALIEEKINQKRNFIPQTSVQSITTTTAPIETNHHPTQTFDFQTSQLPTPTSTTFIPQTPSPLLSPVLQETPVFSNFNPPSQTTSDDLDVLSDHHLTCDILKKLDLKEQFRVPHPPVEKHRRHSDSDHFILPKRPCATFTTSALADLLRNRVVAKRTCRTGSDPGEPLNLDAAFSELPDSLSDLPKFTSAMEEDDGPQDDLGALTTPEDAALPVLSAEDIPQPMLELGQVFFEGRDLGQPFPEISVSELEMMQFATVAVPVTTTVAPLQGEPRPVESVIKAKVGEDSNDDDVFLSPTSLPTSPLKHKKKRRPEPIYIPPYVNTSNFHNSRLRSPRRFDQKNPDQKNLSPPPYTPPPMLSPVRSGSGLFWHIISGSGSLTPKSAPITPSFGLGRKASVGDSTPEMEEEYDEVPESDSVPHVNVGSNYQAKIPPFNPNFKDALLVKHKADKVWDPSIMDSLTNEEVDSYLELSCCALVPGGGRNKEYALHILQICEGKIKDAISSLMDVKPQLPPHHPLLTFQYSEHDKWSPEEIEAYHQGLLKCDKDFFSIAKEIPTKSVKQCIQFYYLWKKVCPDEYKRIRLIRRRKEQESLIYNLRSKEEAQENEENGKGSNSPTPTSTRKNEDSSERQVAVNGTSKSNEVKTYHGNSSVPTSTYNGSGINSTYDFTIEPMEEFPCKICGKVFSKVKSRSAHMKSHRQTDNDKKRYES